jgi:hypothetical protein
VDWIGGPDGAPFMAQKTGSRVLMGFGAIGGLLSAAEQMDDGAHIKDAHHLVNPAASVAQGVATAFASLHDARVAPTAAEKVAGGPRTDGAAWLVSADTLQWGLTSRGLSGHYDVMYLARIEIADVGQKRVIFKGACHHGGETSKGGPSTDYATLMGDGADGLKARFDRISQECVDTFVREHLQPPASRTASK